MSFVERLKRRLSLAVGMVAGAVMFGGVGEDAYAYTCPKPCWVELHCCCLTPCPVNDDQEKRALDKVLDNVKQLNKLYGIKLPALDGSSAAKTPVSPDSLASAGLNAMQQGLRNVIRGPRMADGLGVKMPAYGAHIEESESGSTLPAVHAQTSASGGLETIEKKAGEFDEAFWTTKVMSADDKKALLASRLSSGRIGAVDAMAYAWVKRTEIAAATKKGAELEARLKQANTSSDDVRLNAELRALVSNDLKSLQELIGYKIQQSSSEAIYADRDTTKPARNSSNAGVSTDPPSGTTAYGTYAKARSACEVGTRQAIADHNQTTEVQDLQGLLPTLMSTITAHDARKQQAWDSDGAVASLLGSLYQDPVAAWNTLLSDMEARDKTTYGDQNRYSTALSVVSADASELMAQTSSTRFGKRISNPSCTVAMQNQGSCLPYSVASPGGSWLSPIGEINSYYSSADRVYDAYDRYAAINVSSLSQSPIALPELAVGTAGGAYDEAYAESVAARKAALAQNLQLSVAQASVLLQYRQEAAKRKTYWDAMRRGDGSGFGSELDPDLRQELTSNSMQCFYGPLQTTAGNLASYQGWFDVNPACAWRTWGSGSYAGDEISHEYLGGTDSAVWSIENEINDYKKAQASSPSESQWASAAQSACSAALAAAPAAGATDASTEISQFVSALQALAADAGHASTIRLQ